LVPAAGMLASRFWATSDRDRRSVLLRAPRGEPSLPAARLNGMPSPKEYRQRAKEARNQRKRVATTGNGKDY